MAKLDLLAVEPDRLEARGELVDPLAQQGVSLTCLLHERHGALIGGSQPLSVILGDALHHPRVDLLLQRFEAAEPFAELIALGLEPDELIDGA